MTKGKFRPVLFSVIATMHLMAIFTFVYGFMHASIRPLHLGFSGCAWAWAVGLYALSGIGISVGFHRLFTHGAFRTGPVLKRIFDFLGGLAAEGNMAKWVLDHKQHHRYTDQEWDPHSPSRHGGLKGFMWAHMLWLFYEIKRPEYFEEINGIGLTPLAKWGRWMNPVAVLSGFVLPWYFAGTDGLLLAGFVRVVVHWHVTWCVNSVCHMFGWTDESIRRTKDISKNNFPMAWLTYIGEAYHFFHHQKSDSAYLGWYWWEPDLGKWVIIILEACGLVDHVKRPLGRTA